MVKPTCASRAASRSELLFAPPDSLVLRLADLSRCLSQLEIPLLRRVESTGAALTSELAESLVSLFWTSAYERKFCGFVHGRVRGSGEPPSIESSGSVPGPSPSFGAFSPLSKQNLFLEPPLLLFHSSLETPLESWSGLVRPRLSRIWSGLEIVLSSGLGDVAEKGSLWNIGWCIMLGAMNLLMLELRCEIWTTYE
jgi:hypothetical protein